MYKSLSHFNILPETKLHKFSYQANMQCLFILEEKYSEPLLSRNLISWCTANNNNNNNNNKTNKNTTNSNNLFSIK